MTIKSGKQEAEYPPNKDDVKPKTSIKLCCCSVTQSCSTLCNPMDYSMPGFPVLHHLRSLFKLMSTESVMLSNHFIFCHPLLLLLSIFPSIRVFSNESALHISHSNEYSELISFRIDWFDTLAVKSHYNIDLQFPDHQ